MAKIDLDKLICSLAKRKYFSEEKLQDALKEQDLEYKDGEIVESQKPLYKVGNIIEYKGHYYYIKEIVKGGGIGFYYNLFAFDGGKVRSIHSTGEKDITLFAKCLKELFLNFDYAHANIQQKDYSPKEDEELFFGDFRKIDSEDKGKASFANRQLYNRAILKILSNYVEKYPDIRFGQMLCNLDVNPHFDQESRETYWNLNETINKQK